MKRKVLCFVLTLLAIAVFSIGCGGGGGHSNPASPVISGNAKVSGVVVDSNKKPVENVKVKLTLLSDSVSNNLPDVLKTSSRLVVNDVQTEFNTTTDKNGVYSFSNVPYGRYSLSADGGNVGGLRAATIDGDTQETIPLTPFATLTGKVETTDETPVPVYGAMVNVKDSTLRSFTNNEGIFTLKYIPIDTPYQLVTTLQGYEAPTTSFTISASDLEYTENNNPTYSMVNSPIKLKFKETKSYKVPVKIKANGITIKYPVTIVALDSKQENYAVGVLSSSNDASCTLKITKAGTYTLRAITDDKVISAEKELDTITDTNITSDGTLDPVVEIPFGSSTSESKTVVLRKVLPVEQYVSGTLNYYEGYVSCIGSGGQAEGELCYINVDDETDQGMYSIDDSNVVICGKYSVFYSVNSDSSNVHIYYADDRFGKDNVFAGEFDIAEVDTQQQTYPSFIPEEYIVMNYYNTNDIYQRYCYLTKPCTNLESSISDDYGMNGESEIYLYDKPKMAKDKNGNCYLAVMYSGDTMDFRIYKVGTGDTNPIVNYSFSSGEPYIKDFRALNDGTFYVEMNIASYNTSGTTTTYSKKAYIFQSSATSPQATDDSDREGCFVDSNGNIYRYDPNKKAVVTTDTLNGEPIESYKLQATTTSGTTTTADVNGVLGYRENADSIEVFVY